MDGQGITGTHASRDGERAKILVVEDNPLMLTTIQSLLLAQDYDVRTSANGEDALASLESSPVDLIICDVMMPRMDGYALYKRLREEPQYADIPFIFLTALDDCHDVEKGKSLGADDYVTKPFEPRTLLAVVEGKVVRSKHLQTSHATRMNEFRSRIVQTLSHEFRTPLVAISTGTELLLDHLATIQTKQAQTVLAAIKRGGERLERLVNDFMVVQQIEGGVAQRLAETRARAVSVSEIESGVRSSLGHFSDADRARVCVQPVSPEIANRNITAYLPHIVEIISRLLSNGLKFGAQQPVEVKFDTTENSELRVTVRDFGEGFDLARLPEALALFGQLDRAQFEQQGGGFGLTIAHRLTEVSGGRLDFERVALVHDTNSVPHAFDVSLLFPLLDI